MSINARWRKLEALPARRGRDAMPGVYELADAEKATIYIGQSAKDVPNRIRQHLEGNACILGACYWRYAYSRVPQALEAQLIEQYVAKHGTVPKCNKAVPQPRDALKRYHERSRER